MRNSVAKKLRRIAFERYPLVGQSMLRFDLYKKLKKTWVLTPKNERI
jgi:hypothetical protein